MSLTTIAVAGPDRSGSGPESPSRAERHAWPPSWVPATVALARRRRRREAATALHQHAGWLRVNPRLPRTASVDCVDGGAQSSSGARSRPVAPRSDRFPRKPDRTGVGCPCARWISAANEWLVGWPGSRCARPGPRSRRGARLRPPVRSQPRRSSVPRARYGIGRAKSSRYPRGPPVCPARTS